MTFIQFSARWSMWSGSEVAGVFNRRVRGVIRKARGEKIMKVSLCALERLSVLCLNLLPGQGPLADRSLRSF